MIADSTNAPQNDLRSHNAPKSKMQEESYSYKQSSANLVYENKQGDRFELQVHQEEYSYSRKGYGLGKGQAPKFNFDMETFHQEMRDKILSNLGKITPTGDSQNDKMIDSILYAVEPGTEAAEVPEYWNAENTSQRIIDFALSFESNFDGDKEEFGARIREAIKNGYKEAKEFLGNLPGPSAKLFNDTYELTMKKLDDYFGQEEDTKQQNIAQYQVEQTTQQLNLVA